MRVLNYLRQFFAAVLLVSLLPAPRPGMAAGNAPTTVTTQRDLPRIAIILDDLGYNRPAGEQALQLPGNITYAIIPFTPYAARFAQEAHDRNREIILHMPMQSSDPERKLDTGGLTEAQNEQEVKKRVRSALDSLPYIVGLNNHMGSRVTTDISVMHWVMQEVQERPLYFIDSMTSPQSVANRSAQEYRIPTLKRDVFLDNVQTEAAIDRMFQDLLRVAQEKGHAIAIGHPHPATLAYLEKTLPQLDKLGVQLVDASELVMLYGQPVDSPVDLKQLREQIIAMPAPESMRLNFAD